MRVPATILQTMLGGTWFSHPWRRRLTFVLAAAVLALFTIWPRHYVARAQLLPADAGNGLSAAISQAGNLIGLGALIAQSQSIESELTVSRSEAVLNQVLRNTDFAHRRGFHDQAKAAVALRRKSEISAIRGSILQVEVKDRDPGMAKAIASAYAQAIQNRLAEISYRQGADRQVVAADRLRETSEKLARAQAALNQFRTSNQLAAPTVQLGAAVTQVAELQGALQAKEVELNTLSTVETPQNAHYKMVQAELESLRRQVDQSEKTSPNGLAQPTALAARETQYFNLYRDERFAQAMYEIYSRYLEQVTVEEMSARNNMDIVEPPYVDPARQYNVLPLGLLVFVVLLAIGSEYYVVRPPSGVRQRGASSFP